MFYTLDEVSASLKNI